MHDQILFAARPPSIQWEPLPLARFPGMNVWAWFRPGNLPSGITIRIPPEFAAAYAAGFPFTLADLVTAAGADVHQFHSISLFGGPWQPSATFFPFLNHPIPSAPPGASSEICIALTDTPIATPAPVVNTGSQPPLVGAGVGTDASMYDRIEALWKACVQMERQMSALRSKLASMLQSLGKLDRDLAPQERVAAERDDRDAWDESRRWLRDMSAKCHRELKAFDIGMTSGAGKRNALEHLYQTVIEPRVPQNDLESIHRNFEMHRKEVVNLQRAMTTALQAASTNGTQRAHRVLAAIGKKMLARRAKMREAIGGTNMDKSVRKKR